MAKGDNVLMVHGEAREPHLLRGPGHQVVIITQGHVGLEVFYQLPDLPKSGALGRKLLKGMENGGPGGHPVIFINGQGAGYFHHRVLGLKDCGPPVMGDKKEFVLGKMACNGKGPDGMAVQGAVDAIKDFCHGQSIDQEVSNDNGKIVLDG